MDFYTAYVLTALVVGINSIRHNSTNNPSKNAHDNDEDDIRQYVVAHHEGLKLSIDDYNNVTASPLKLGPEAIARLSTQITVTIIIHRSIQDKDFAH